MYRLDYLEENRRLYVDLRDYQLLLTAIKKNAQIEADDKTLDLIISINASFIDSVDEGSIESDTCINLEDEDIIDIQKELNKEYSKQDRLLAKANRKVASKKFKKDIEKQISEIDKEDTEEESDED